MPGRIRYRPRRSELLAMFEAYWGLQRGPFSDQFARQSLATSPTHGEALARLDFLRDSRGRLGLLLGPAGSGKSLVVQEFARRAERAGARAIVVPAAAADGEGLLGEIATGLGASGITSTAGHWRA